MADTNRTAAFAPHNPNRYDVVGSFLRPEALRVARERHACGELDDEGLRAVEDEQVRLLVERETEAGLKVITDGEFRRSTWHLDFIWAFGGIGHCPTRDGIPFHDEPALIDDTYLTGPLSLEGEHPFVDHWRFVDALAAHDQVAKLTVPAPAQFLEQLVFPANRESTGLVYKSEDALVDAVVGCYGQFVEQVYAAGCRNLQFDDCSWGCLVDPNASLIFGVGEEGLAHLRELLLRVNNRVLDARPDDLVVNTHVCRGNFHSTWACQGGYEGVADALLAREHVDAFFLEFDDERSGGFEPLDAVPDDKCVVLGLVTTKRPELEDEDALVARIHEAARHVPLERLCLSPQCGFASCECGNKLTEEEQWTKVALIRRVAERVWG